ncbi:hypothetical protein CD351_14740 [Erythrobacter sp. KY5]|uniref:HWE histidine kinase domain-containing protein n=1 Tax=Erythrobacter sp. KY5 TaxID=2011159 RepID=UPI000DBF202A|nr:HWE histidine kinase domain-containing protein [Erythrobacter sp. KY5]AWW75690.1 hypothetical protein CD351_14740 [Erythrobacter sp. KY5]
MTNSSSSQDKAADGSGQDPGASPHYALDMERELSHRVKNMFAVINAIVSITGRVKNIPQEAAEINARIQALGRAYETTFEGSHTGAFDIGEAIEAVLRPYAQSAERLSLEGDTIRAPSATISLVGMVLHEFAINARKHGAWRGNGSVSVKLVAGCSEGLTCDVSAGDAQAITLIWTERGGPATDADTVAAGGGTEIVDRLLATARGTIERNWTEEGLEAKICIPVARVG